MTKILRITRDFNYFDGTIDNGYQELEVDKEYWESLEEYEREELFAKCSNIVGSIYPYDHYELHHDGSKMEIEEFERKQWTFYYQMKLI